MEPELTQKQQEALKETLERGGAFEEMLTTRGWQYIQAYYQNQIKVFMNDLMNKEEAPITEFENRRHELLGLKKLIGQIEGAISVLKQKREEQISEPS